LPDIVFTAPEQVPGLETGVVKLAVGYGHNCVLTNEGEIKCWGWNNNGQCGDGTNVNKKTPTKVPGLAAMVAVTAGGAHTCAITETGGLMCWGANALGQLGDGTTYGRLSPRHINSLSLGVVAVSCGNSHTCAYTSANKAMCWGSNGSRRLGDGTTTDRLSPVEVIGFP